MEIKHKSFGIYEKYIKRPLDCVLAIFSIGILFPVIIFIALLVKVKLGSPVLYTQERPGMNGTVFKLYKFRTMSDSKDKYGNFLPDDERLSSFGRKLRLSSLDELPELFNIVKGDMSIVGPRPLLVEYLPYYTKKEFRRHDVRPGLTGWAQVNGRNAINNWEERFQYDIEYVENVSFFMDIKIIFLTIYKVLKRSDIQVGSEIKAGRLDQVRGEKINESRG